MNKLKEWFVIICDSFRQLIAWLPLIWKDRDWDSQYLFIMMKFKIERMIRLFKRCKVHILGHENEIKQMKIAMQLLNRLIEDDYSIEAYKNKSKCSCPDPDYRYEPSEFKHAVKMVCLKCNYCTDNLKKWFDKLDLKQKEDKQYLFSLIEKHSNSWWC